MKRLLTTLVILTGLIGSGGAVWAQDFNKGLKAAQSGDFVTALKEWTLLAERGNAQAQFGLAFFYFNGVGVTQDYTEALKWHRKAAEQGNAGAQFNLALMYDNGKGVTQDYAEAVKWYRKAAEQGEIAAQFNLGLMYEKGKGVLKDTGAAHMWFNISAANGWDAGEDRDALAMKLTEEQLEKNNERAKRCMASDYKDCD